MSEKILEINHLSKSFGANVVLRDIDFTVKKGDVTCIIGASGSGKSTLLRWWEKKMDGSDSYDLATTDTLAHTTGMYNFPGQGSPYDEKSKEYDQKRGAEHV